MILKYLPVCFSKVEVSFFRVRHKDRPHGYNADINCFLLNNMASVADFSYLCIGKVEKVCTKMPLCRGKSGVLPSRYGYDLVKDSCG